MSKIKAIELIYLFEKACKSIKQTCFPMFTIDSIELIDDDKSNKTILNINYSNLLEKKQEVLSHSIGKSSVKETNEIIRASIKGLEKNQDDNIKAFVDDAIKVIKKLIIEEDKEDENIGK